jgi:hypothetical protein
VHAANAIIVPMRVTFADLAIRSMKSSDSSESTSWARDYGLQRPRWFAFSSRCRVAPAWLGPFDRIQVCAHRLDGVAPRRQLSNAPAATHACTAAVACAFDEGPPGGMEPPIQLKSEERFDCVPFR